MKIHLFREPGDNKDTLRSVVEALRKLPQRPQILLNSDKLYDYELALTKYVDGVFGDFMNEYDDTVDAKRQK